MLLRVQLEVRQQNRDILNELQQLRHEVRVSERLDETEPLDKTRAVSQPALSTVPPVLPRLPADDIKELEAAVRDEAVAATLPRKNWRHRRQGRQGHCTGLVEGLSFIQPLRHNPYLMPQLLQLMQDVPVLLPHLQLHLKQHR
ncbi:hypothetical protein HPB49_005588 [Dermacentor silvarum]|uniref:Uncharacterized protein n=1 Tax=Dermacentor silvarum TaxID=543639 RepID=A0ACB8DVW5_DERSI|nr:hypothetical protein HPB49_005588 [Dermacentor silvarum]